MDYRRLNAMTVRVTYPIPRMEECIESVRDDTVFTALDTNWRYLQDPVTEKDYGKTALICHAGSYRFEQMSFWFDQRQSYLSASSTYLREPLEVAELLSLP